MSGELIWVVEDNDQNFELVDYLLSENGYRVLRARDGGEVRRLLSGEAPHLVLLDMNLPSGSGLDIVGELRHSPLVLSAPIVAVTAHAMRGDRERFLAAGCDEYISKPIETSTFLETVRALLDRAAGNER
ncbi:MAG: response regulator [Thermoanaerobaculia bacterium]